MIMMYQDYVRSSQDTTPNESKINRRMGRIGNVNDSKRNPRETTIKVIID